MQNQWKLSFLLHSYVLLKLKINLKITYLIVPTASNTVLYTRLNTTQYCIVHCILQFVKKVDLVISVLTTVE